MLTPEQNAAWTFRYIQAAKRQQRTQRLTAALEDAQKYRGMKRKGSVSTTKKAPATKKRAVTTTKANNKFAATLYAYPIPDKIRTRLKVLQNIGLISALTSSSALVYRPTSYFDVDPAIGGASFAGYTYFASAYNRYRVTGFKYKATFVNLESTSVLVGCQAIGQVAQPNSGTAADYTEYAVENEWGQYRVCGPTTAQPKEIIEGWVDCVKLWGTPEARTSAPWASNIGTSPAANSWLRISAHSANNANLTIGVQCILEIESYGYWMEKNPDIGN